MAGSDVNKARPLNDPYCIKANHFFGHECFEFKLAIEGRIWEFRNDIETEMKNGATKIAARSNVQKKYGYLGVKEERQWFSDYLRSSSRGKKQTMDADLNRRTRATGKNKMFEDALKELPSRADPQIEIDWVKGHPAMTRKDRQKKVEHILITADDILDSSTGICPSRAAAQQLQHWVNNPGVFYKDYMVELKRALKDGGANKQELDTRAKATDEDIDAVLDVLISAEIDPIGHVLGDEEGGGMQDGSII